MSELAEFLTARLEEDERTAKMAAEDASAGAHWHVDARFQHSGHAGVSGENGEAVVYDEGSPADCEARHIARRDPARALREAELHREILFQHQTVAEWGPGNWPRPLLLLAAIWADHPDYDPAWAPEVSRSPTAAPPPAPGRTASPIPRTPR